MRVFYFLLFASFGFLMSCASGQTLVGEQDRSTPLIEGVITDAYRDQGCAFLFEFEDPDGVKQLVRPLGLEETYRHDGLQVRMKFRMSRAMNDGCDLAHPVIVEHIEVVEL